MPRRTPTVTRVVTLLIGAVALSGVPVAHADLSGDPDGAAH